MGNSGFEPEETDKEIHTVVLGSLDGYAFESIARVYSVKALCPTLSTMGGGDRQPKILVGNRCGS